MHIRPTSNKDSDQRNESMRLPHTITRSVHAQRVLEKCTCAQPLMLFAGMERFRRAVGCVVTCSRRIQCHPPNLPRRSQSTAPAQTRFPTTFAPTNRFCPQKSPKSSEKRARQFVFLCVGKLWAKWLWAKFCGQNSPHSPANSKAMRASKNDH